MTNVVTVTCSGDKWVMALQAHSMEKHVVDPITHYVLIEDDTMDILEWEFLLKPIYKKHKLVLIDRNSNPELYIGFNKNTNDYVESGWHRQQILKLTISQKIKTDYYVTLDSKNIFINSTEINKSCHGFEGSGTLLPFDIDGEKDIPGVSFWEPWAKILENKYDFLIRPKNIWFAGTPFIFKTSVVNQILEKIDLVTDFNIIRDELVIPPSEYVLYAYFSKNIKNHIDFPIKSHSIDLLKNDIKEVKKLFYKCSTMTMLTAYRRNADEDNRKFFKYIIPYLINYAELDPIYVNMLYLNRKNG